MAVIFLRRPPLSHQHLTWQTGHLHVAAGY